MVCLPVDLLVSQLAVFALFFATCCAGYLFLWFRVPYMQPVLPAANGFRDDVEPVLKRVDELDHLCSTLGLRVDILNIRLQTLEQQSQL